METRALALTKREMAALEELLDRRLRNLEAADRLRNVPETLILQDVTRKLRQVAWPA